MQNLLNKAILNGGITIKITPVRGTAEVVSNHWYYPALPDKTLICTPADLRLEFADFALQNKAELLKPGRYLGVWLNPSENKYYLDINERAASEDSAKKRVGQINQKCARKILAIYNPSTSVTVSI